MKKSAVELWVGVFVFICLLCVGYLTIKLGKMEWLGGENYYIKGNFGSVSGLHEGALVDLAGVRIGQVHSITLDLENNEAVVTLKISSDVPLDDALFASVKTSGLIGDKYIKIEPGGSETMLKDGDLYFNTESAIDLEEMIAKYAFGEV